MANFSTDADLVKWEPTLFRDLAAPGLRLSGGGDGVTAGLTLTSASAGFTTQGVAPGHVVHLSAADGTDFGCYEVLSVESATALLATDVGRDATDSVDLPVGQPWTYTIDTFDAQAEEVRFELLSRLGLESDRRGADQEAWILDRRVLRRASVFATLAMIFEGQSGGNEEGRTLAAKAVLYRGLYEKEMAKIRVRLDRNGDGVADDMRSPGSARLSRD